MKDERDCVYGLRLAAAELRRDIGPAAEELASDLERIAWGLQRKINRERLRRLVEERQARESAIERRKFKRFGPA